MEQKIIPVSIANVFLWEEQLIGIRFTRDGELDEKAAIDILKAVLDLSAGKPHAIYYDFNNYNILLSNIAKKLASVRNDLDSNLIARAFLSRNLMNQIEANHFIQHSKPLAETRVFQSEKEALKWLRAKIHDFKAVDKPANPLNKQ
ncbi:MAG TPA: hypothetical protein VNZ86_04560 [Bacteroidia bacterium]|nr:hypothetical protein [Bacteroidia bacterium]